MYKPSEEFKQGDPKAKQIRYQEISKLAGCEKPQQTSYADNMELLRRFLEKSEHPEKAGQIPQIFAPPEPMRVP